MKTTTRVQGSAAVVSASASASGPVRTAGPPHGEPSSEPGSTREAVIRCLLERPGSAATIALRLGISAAGVRRHLEVLADEHAVVGREIPVAGPRGRGRPAKVYRLTDIGRSRLPQAYDALAADAIAYLAEIGGDDAVTAFARRRAEELVRTRRAELDATPDQAGRVAILRDALTDAGFSASVADVNGGSQLCQHHCPVAHVAAEYPQLCQAELEVFAEVVGSHAQRLATIARGDSFCTTFVPGAAGSGTHQPQAAPDKATDQGRITR
ncbi:MAG: metalloregulator ArsR/SmtB family transcription factor [Nakamurella sp.]